MSDLTVSSPVSAPAAAAAYTHTKAPSQAEPKPAPKYDVIDLSKPPTAEQAERMRSAGILGYGSVSVKKSTVTDSSGVTAVTESYQNTFFDVVNEGTYQFSFKEVKVLDLWHSDFSASTTTQSFQSWDDGSWMQATLHESAFHLELHGPSWITPSYVDEEGTIHLAQLAPSAKASISGYRSSLTVAQSGGGKTQVSHLETSAIKTEVTIPKRPAGAIRYNDWFLQTLPKGTLELVNRQAALLSRYLESQD